jgi:hypothetical protein
MKYKNADLLNRLSDMQRAPYYATACHTLVQAEQAIVNLETEIIVLRQAISQPDCRGCVHFFTSAELGECDDVEGGCYLAGICTNGDEFQALPKVMLYKVT